MGRGNDDPMHTNKPSHSWSDIRQHQSPKSRWIVIENQVYDVTRWAYKHPGGSKVLGHFSGQDGTEPFHAFHNDLKLAHKYMKPMHVGHVDSCDPERKSNIKKEFNELRLKAESIGLFDANHTFFVLHLLHIIVLEGLAYASLRYFGTSWLPYLVSVFLFGAAQAQASWTQHDYGHLSVFKNRRFNIWAHQFTMSFFKGASAHWWNHMHYQHHSKPNVMGKDPDVRLQPLFVVGETMPLEVAKEKKSIFSYNLQQHYFFCLAPPLLFPVYFQLMTIRHVILRRRYLDMALMAGFFARLLVLFGPLLGFGGAFAYYFFARIIESHWFTWVSQSNHIPMAVEHDHELPWLEQQIHATCDVEQSWFNDWFTGHLNFQIEHHLFPTMPRHNYIKVKPMVQQLCQKHGIRYETKPLWTAFCDVIKSLRRSGELWEAAYHAHHLD